MQGVSDNIQEAALGGGSKQKQGQGKVAVVPREEKVDIPVHSKVNILLQTHISRLPVEDFALISDTAYAAQNGGRIVRALLEIAISRKWANAAAVLMGISKAIEKRMWPFDQPLKQFTNLKYETIYALQEWADEWTPAELASQTPTELAQAIHSNEHHAAAIITAAQQFPSASITYRLQPLGFDVLRISLLVEPAFKWSSKIHGSAEPFWVWIEDSEGLSILQLTHLVFRSSAEPIPVDFIIGVPNGQPPPFITVRFVSDSWLGAENELAVPMNSLIMPEPSVPHTRILDLPFLTLAALNNAQVERIFQSRIAVLGAIQSQAFWSLVNTQCHSLLCSPAASGKTLLSQVLVWYVPFHRQSKYLISSKSIGQHSLGESLSLS